MKNKILLLVVAFALPLCMWANNVQCTVTNYNDTTKTLSLSFNWDNSWHISDFKDGILLFIKYKDDVNPVWRKAPIGQGIGFVSPNHGDAGNVSYTYSTPLLGLDMAAAHNHVIISRASTNTGNGSVAGTVDLGIHIPGAVNPSFKVFAIEMVYIPQGEFYVGDGLYPTYTNGNSTEPLKVTSEAAISVGIGTGMLNPNIPVNGPTYLAASADFPKGHRAFWIMKYELSQEIYAEYLNCLPRNQQDAAVQASVNLNAGTTTATNYFVMTNQSANPSFRQGIRCGGNFTPSEPITFFCDLDNDSVANGAADAQNNAVRAPNPGIALKFLDWAGMRPMTGYEYEKACRGPLHPVPGELAWGSAASFTPVVSNAGSGDEYYLPVSDGPFIANTALRNGVFATATSTRKQSGGSYYGVMELSNSLPETHVGYYESTSTPTFNHALGDGDPSNGLPATWPLACHVQLTNSVAAARVSSILGPLTNTGNYPCAIRGVVE